MARRHLDKKYRDCRRVRQAWPQTAMAGEGGSTADLLHPFTPGETDARHHDGNYDGPCQLVPQLAALFGGKEEVARVHRIRVLIIPKMVRTEEPVARPGRHQKIGKWPLHGGKNQEEQDSRYGGEQPAVPLAGALP